MDREQAREEALRRVKRKRMGRPTQAPMTAGPIPKRRMSLSQMERLKERQRRRQAQQAAGMVMGAAVSVAKKDKINKNVKDKIKKIGEMKVKDVASSIGKAFAVTTPIGIGRTISKKIQQGTNKTPSKQERIERTAPRMPKLMDKFLREKNKRRPERLLTGGQAKLDKNKNGRIDAQDFKILKAEKAKGRGKGLQDEKMKPGKMMKAKQGILAKLLGGKKKMVVITGMKPQDRYGQQFKPTPIKPKKKMGGGMMKKPMGFDKGGVGMFPAVKSPTDKMKPTVKTFKKRRKTLSPSGKMGGGMMMQRPMGYSKGSKGAIKPTGKVLEAIKADYKKNQPPKGSKKPGKMGGGMMMRPNPVGYSKGVMVKTKIGRNKPTKMY